MTRTPPRLPGASYLKCTETGERFEPEQLIGLSPAGKPLFACYDLESLRGRFTPDSVVGRAPTMWRYEEVLPVRDPASRVTLG